MNKLIIISIAFLISCEEKQTVSKPLTYKEYQQKRRSEYSVKYLFEKDGIKVYSFRDDENTHYFTTNGETINTIVKHYGGKMPRTTYREENINTKLK